MGRWGKGLLQSDDDYDIAKDLSEMVGFELLSTEDQESSVEKLNDGLLAEKFDKIISPTFQPRTGKRERVVIILGMLAMEMGAILEGRHLMALKMLRPFLPTMEQQLQLVTALEEYKNDGTPWISGSKDFMETMASSRRLELNEFDLGDEFWFSGLGHSSDEDPTSETFSKRCLGCGEGDIDLLRCSKCKMARYCNTTCQQYDWATHKKVCEPREEVRRCPIPNI